MIDVDCVITLIKKTLTNAKDQYGDAVYTEKKTTVFAEMLSIGMNEFYQAMSAGVKPELKFKLTDFHDYHNEEEVVYENMRYKVLRTYRADTELEITVYGGVHECTEVCG